MKEKKYFYEMNSSYLNILSIALFVFMIMLTVIIIKVFNLNIEINNFNMSITYFLLFPYMMVHEILHSIGYVINGVKFNKISYGIHLEKGILCCSCKQEIERKCILWSLIYPLLFIGIITYILGLIFNLPILLMLSIINIAGCIGDIIMFLEFIKIDDFKYFEYDNPLAFGITTSKDMSNYKMFALKQFDEKNYKQTNNKKIEISKTSILFLVFYYLIGIINIIL